MIGIKVDEKMKEAIQKAAEKKFMSLSGYIKYAVQLQLEAEGIQWREEKKPSRKK